MSESVHLTSSAASSAAKAHASTPRERAFDREYDWTRYAVLSGVVGASVVAIVFLVVDLASGRPMLWTPAVLGSALFLGESIGEGGGLVPTDRLAVVLGYTMVHGVVFVGFGALAASERLTRRRVADFGAKAAVVMAALLFVALEITFAALGWIVGADMDLGFRLGSGWIAVANALAALAMTATIAQSARRLSEHSDDQGAA